MTLNLDDCGLQDEGATDRFLCIKFRIRTAVCLVDSVVLCVSCAFRAILFSHLIQPLSFDHNHRP